jgi:hypothetical protein
MLLWESANANANDTLFINKIAGHSRKVWNAYTNGTSYKPAK